MTSSARPAEPALMYIILQMATETGGGQPDLVFYDLTMAGVALQIFMGSREMEFGLSIMIVCPEFPSVRVVALAAASS